MRFRLPVDLASRTGTLELRRSLHTRDIDVARRRCLTASAWFQDLVDRLRGMENITRLSLEQVASEYFDRLLIEVEVPRRFEPEDFDNDLAFNIEATRERIRALDDQLRTNIYGPEAETAASTLVSSLAGSFEALDEALQLVARQLAAKAHRAQMRYLEHRLSNPALPYVSDDPLFALHREKIVEPPNLQGVGVPSQYACLSDLVTDHLERMERRHLGESHIDETGRALSWLIEEIGPDTPMDRITVESVRAFRDNIRRMDRTRQGRSTTFKKRLTDRTDRQITNATAAKYWGAVRMLFSWARSEGRSPYDPTEHLRFDKHKREERRSPPPFVLEEVRRFISTPLYQGHQSRTRLFEEGDCHERGQKWWAGIMFMVSGARAGEITQLLPSDFHFDEPIPYVRVQEEDETGERTKSVKSAASIRDIPLVPLLLDLGLREFVDRRRALQPKARVFEQFRMGTRGKRSEGMVRFWGDYLRRYGLHKPGRGTHVWRHTVIANLRATGALEEDIQAVVGHDRKTVTSGYGGAYPLSRKHKTLAKLDYGFDVVEALGGAYVASMHRV